MNSEEESVRIFCFPSPRSVVLFRVLVHPLVLESRNTHSCSPNLSKRCRLIRPHALLEHRTKKKRIILPFCPSLESVIITHTRPKKHHHHHHVRRCLLRESRRSDDANAKVANEKSRCKSTGESVVFQR